MKLITSIVLPIILMMPWFINAYKFANCDFEPDYKCEAIHGVGIFIPPASYVTVFFDTDKGDK